jgi:aminopeptidase N
LAEQELFGDDHFYMKMYDIAEQLQRASKTDTIPIWNEKASSLSFYQKGAWALQVLREGVGKDNFREAVKNYLEKYKFKNVDTDGFLAEINKVSGYDTAAFRKKWLEAPGFEVEEAIELLKKNVFMRSYFALLALQEKPFSDKKEAFKEILKSDAYFPLKEEVVFQMTDVPFADKKELLGIALQTNDLYVRQAVANTMSKIDVESYPEYVKLLDDNSYITKEVVLGNLWKQFPEKQRELLEKTKGQIGFNDKNLRIQWLTLALITKNYENDQKAMFYDELLDYASPKYESTVRQNAMENLLYLDPNDTNVLQALADATIHHKWQFTKYARDHIREFLKKEKYRTFYTELLPKLPENEQAQLNKLLKE